MNLDIIPVTSFQQNCSLVWDEQKNAAIIDPGGDVQKLIEKIYTHGLTLKAILLTHGHLDHVGGAIKLKEEFKVEILGSHIADKFWFDNLSVQSQQFGLFEMTAFEPDRWLEEGEIIEVGQLRFEVLHLPGHTPGHVGFIERSQRIAFTGDVLFRNSIGRTDFPQGNHQELLNSISQKLYPLGNDWIIIPGHGGYTTIGQERGNNPYLQAI